MAEFITSFIGPKLRKWTRATEAVKLFLVDGTEITCKSADIGYDDGFLYINPGRYKSSKGSEGRLYIAYQSVVMFENL